MSALTKVFIILHVVMSLLLTAGLIVFVNRVENFRVALAAAEDRAKAATDAATEARVDAVAARGEAAAAYGDAQRRVERAQRLLAEARNTIRERDVAIGQRAADVERLQAALTSANAALEVAQGTNQTQTTHLTELRTSLNDIQRQNSELRVALSDLRNRADVATQRVRSQLEDIQTLQEENARLRNQLAERGAGGTDVATSDDGGDPPAPNADINGVIRATRTISGIPYATISVGQADGVTRNMRFTVIDQEEGRFLGYLTVENVEANEATGRLEGPNARGVRQGNQVTTQL